jgi:cyclophilin family peptidyl-prolyl cis-trans isomerase
MVDEVGLRSHTRGALGISTRGHDTGDAQFFVDLCDNVSLDHTFGVWAEVTKGMDVVDGVIEGDTIDRIEIAVAPSAGRTR